MKQRPRRSRAPIGREGKRQGFETETQEVLITYRKGGKGQGFETETQEVLSTYSKGGKAEGFRKRDSGSLELYRECVLPTKETRQEPQTK